MEINTSHYLYKTYVYVAQGNFVSLSMAQAGQKVGHLYLKEASTACRRLYVDLEIFQGHLRWLG